MIEFSAVIPSCAHSFLFISVIYFPLSQMTSQIIGGHSYHFCLLGLRGHFLISVCYNKVPSLRCSDKAFCLVTVLKAIANIVFLVLGLLVLGNRYKAFWATVVLASVTAVSVILAISA